jgi:Protein of unknown function (DUF2961)
MAKKISRRDFISSSGTIVGLGAIGGRVFAADLENAKISSTSMGMSDAGWPFDSRPDLALLKAHTAVVVADIKGPAVIQRIHTSRYAALSAKNTPEDDPARGIVLEIYYNGSNDPAVCVPLADFFLDGSRRATRYSTLFLEKTVGSYNSYLTIPFEKSARVILRNDLPYDLIGYSFVEWETLPAWDKSLGYFHATWDRTAFQLDGDTDMHFLRLEGAGHLFGRSLAIATDEEFFEGFEFVQEGNVEIRIDGSRSPQIEYLGSEDSFRNSWGWSDTFVGLRNGVNYAQQTAPALVSTYCFWDPHGIPFAKSLDLTVNWTHEFRDGRLRDADYQSRLSRKRTDGGCWIDFASTYFWYQQVPGFKHSKMLSTEDRRRVVLHSNA